MNHVRKWTEDLLFVAVAFILVASMVVRGQTRTVIETAQPDWTELHCTRNADASIECYVCVGVIADDGTARNECGRQVRVLATINQNRANGLAGAMRDRTLSARFGVDAGTAP
jgi:hypothetical protein